MTGSNAILAVVVGAIVVIVGFSLWPVLNATSNHLYSYFRDSCDDGSGNRFLRMYEGIDTTGLAGNALGATQYNHETGIHGGKGVTVSGTTLGICQGTFPGAIAASARLFNEQGEQIGNSPTGTLATPFSVPLEPTYEWIEVADILKRFSGINNLLLTILPVISIAGFLGVSGGRLYSYGKGASNIGSAISTSIFTLIAIVVAMVIVGPVIGSLVEANLVVESGQYQINSVFGNIISLLFAMIPIIYIAGLVTLVGLQAKSALMGGRDILP